MFGAALVIGALALPIQSEAASAATMRFTPSNIAPQSAETALTVQKVSHRGGYRGYGRGGGRQYGYRRGGGRDHGYRRGGGRHYGHKRAARRYAYNRSRHGPRYRSRQRHNRHYYDGFWYAVPFWLGALAAGSYDDGEPYRADGAHVDWCLDTYRSYNRRTDTYRGYDGYDHLCISPYS